VIDLNIKLSIIREVNYIVHHYVSCGIKDTSIVLNFISGWKIHWLNYQCVKY